MPGITVARGRFLVETAGSNAAHDEEKFDSFLEGAMADGLVLDGVVSSSERQCVLACGDKAATLCRETHTHALVSCA